MARFLLPYSREPRVARRDASTPHGSNDASGVEDAPLGRHRRAPGRRAPAPVRAPPAPGEAHARSPGLKRRRRTGASRPLASGPRVDLADVAERAEPAEDARERRPAVEPEGRVAEGDRAGFVLVEVRALVTFVAGEDHLLARRRVRADVGEAEGSFDAGRGRVRGAVRADGEALGADELFTHDGAAETRRARVVRGRRRGLDDFDARLARLVVRGVRGARARRQRLDAGVGAGSPRGS